MKRLKKKIINWLFDGTVTLNPGYGIEYTDRDNKSGSELNECGCEEKTYDTSHDTYEIAKKNSDSGKLIIDAATSVCPHEDIQRRDILDKETAARAAELEHWFGTMCNRLRTTTNSCYSLNCISTDVSRGKFNIFVTCPVRNEERKEINKFLNITTNSGIRKTYIIDRDLDKLDITRLVETLEKRFSDELNEIELNESEEGEC